jgi:2-methylcitrate dehydratase PrpD
MVEGLGESFEIERISFKPWPSCRGTHAAIEAALIWHAEAASSCDLIEKVSIQGGPMLRILAEPLTSKRQPATAIDAKFSLPFTVASALLHGGVGLQSFLPETLVDPAVLSLASRIHVDATLPVGSPIGARLRVQLRDGTAWEQCVSSPLGSPDHPLPVQTLRAKFIECAGLGLDPLSPARATRLADAILSLEKMADIGEELAPLLR